MQLGAFSISLSVKNLETSIIFYEKLGFSAIGGNLDSKYVIMKNDQTVIGLFEKMFEGNMLTFNPGWDQEGNMLKQYDDIRTIQKDLINNGVKLANTIEETTIGPANLMLTDPDGNVILIDQHV
ncbi:VOC family protein [Aureibacter tunicatorum]|uniref:Lactoylglutathione lyase n=1 Tax=Aureibacter tunicatorum TaxID=866807 RepID=A0AAE3XMX6_9BACT|nr:VOC family protein [Aureibacter tunicatorum]MDR6239538.1 putative lactoylglutathione lyase [Aureibacter tunicatorum]BDD04015.1 hypothetical protein AUTU_14980 [Aureibacter tunicatorum]